ncbi:pirin family protein [Roseivirga echinicomitans]
MSNSILKIQPLSFPWQTSDPFLFCAFHHDNYPKGNGQMGPDASLSGRNIGADFGGKDGWSMYHGQTVPGFPAHPHRGFETVTIAERGLVDHSDSLGAAGRFGNGDVQWMTAGKGVQHAEMFPLLNENETNPLVLFQIWLNLPKMNKMVEPHFAMLWSEDIPTYNHTDQNGNQTKVIVVSGNIEDTVSLAPAPDSWAADVKNEVAIWTITLAPNAEWEMPLASAGINRSLYFYAGANMEVDGNTVEKGHMIKVDATKATQLKNGSQESKLLMLQGKPIGEPVAQHGPFVMNDNAEIRQAMNEYQNTQFGGWPWPKHDHTHENTRGRFALHADGKEEIK